MKSRAETETVIRRSADDDHWVVFSEDQVIIRKMVAIHGPGRVKGLGQEWSVPRNAIGFRRARQLSDDQRAKMSARLKVARDKIASGKPDNSVGGA